MRRSQRPQSHILTRAVRSQQKAEKELLHINAKIERLNKRKAELEAHRAHKKRAQEARLSGGLSICIGGGQQQMRPVILPMVGL